MTSIDYVAKVGYYKNKLLEVFDELPKEFYKEPFKDYILENLKTYDKNIVQNALTKYFGITDFIDHTNKNDNRTAFIFKFDKDITELDNMLKFYGWNISDINEDNYILVVPTYTMSKTSYVRNECFNWVYHICLKRDLQSILKSGLRCKTGKSYLPKYREFPKRIYCIATSPKEAVKAIKDTFDEITKNKGDYSQFALIKLKSTNEFYSDDCLKSENAIFTYNSIPAKDIVHYWDLKEFFDKFLK